MHDVPNLASLPSVSAMKPDDLAKARSAFGEKDEFPDHDCDGIPDDVDEDVDNDGLLDRTQDSDWDGDINTQDKDDDNDGGFKNSQLPFSTTIKL